MKICSKCQKGKPLDKFFFRKDQGCYRRECKPCCTERGKIWVSRNLLKCRAIALRWAKSNYPYLRMKKAEYRITKPLMMNKWNRENPDRKKALNKLWREANKGKVLASVRNRQIGKLHATPAWADLGEIEKIYLEAARRNLHVDHIVPLRHPRVCGLHVQWNLQLLSPSENYRKSNRWQ